MADLVRELSGAAMPALTPVHRTKVEGFQRDVSPHARKIARLEMHIGVSKRKPAFKVELRDIPIGQ